MYDSWVISFYNILFTGLPIFLVAAFDQPISRRQIMDYPPLYRNGIRHQSVRALSEERHHQTNPNSLTRLVLQFSSFKYWQWQLWAVIQAVVVTMFSIAAFRNDILVRLALVAIAALPASYADPCSGSQLGNGQTLDAFALGLEIMTVVVLVANAKIFLITKYVAGPHSAMPLDVVVWY
jgi:magnesium-transporting ATPase (P-type)